MAKNDFKDVEYLAVVDGDRTLLLLKEVDLKNKSKLDIQELIGDKLGAGRFAINMKLKNDPAIRNTRMRSLTKEIGKENLKDTTAQSLEIKKLNEKIDQLTNNKSDIGIDYLLDITKQSYIMQIEILKSQISGLNEKIYSLEKKNDELERELDKIDSESNSNALINTLQSFLMPKAQPKTSGSLKDNVNEKNIPVDFLEVLSKIDYSKVPDKDLNNYLGVFQQFANNLPQRETA